MYIVCSRGGATLTGQDSSDTDLVTSVADGDITALGHLYDRYHRAIYGLCLRVTRDAATAEEVTQEVFVRLWRSAASFQEERGRVSTWLLRIAHNLALNEVRRRQSRPVIAFDTDWRAEGERIVDSYQAHDPTTVAELGERAQAVHAALLQLPEPQRKAIELAYFGGLSQAEVAAALGDPLGTVKSRIRVGMQRLHELLLSAGIDEVS